MITGKLRLKVPFYAHVRDLWLAIGPCQNGREAPWVDLSNNPSSCVPETRTFWSFRVSVSKKNAARRLGSLARPKKQIPCTPNQTFRSVARPKISTPGVYSSITELWVLLLWALVVLVLVILLEFEKQLELQAESSH